MTYRDPLLISVVIPLYNAERYIEETLTSVLSQTYQNWEAIIVDNCSTDSSLRYVQPFIESDKRFKLYSTGANSGGPAKPRNVGIQHAKGDFVAFLDADDIWLPEKLEKVIDYLQKDPSLDLVCHDELVLTHGKMVKRLTYGPYKCYQDLLFKDNVLSPSAVAVRKQLLSDVEMFSERADFNTVEDYELWLRLFFAGARVFYLHQALGCFRVEGQGASSINAQHFENQLNVLNYHFYDFQSSVLYKNHPINKRLGKVYVAYARCYQKIGEFSKAKAILGRAKGKLRFSLKRLVILILCYLGVKR